MSNAKGPRLQKKIPPNFDDVKQGFVDRIADVVREFHIPPDLVINLDETGLKIVPVSTWTLEKKGVTQVPIVGIEDKRPITAVLATTLDGQLLPPQLLYEGRTNRCHPTVVFPKEWDIFHSKNHWAPSIKLESVESCALNRFMAVR